MRRPQPKDGSREGRTLFPPRFASESLGSQDGVSELVPILRTEQPHQIEQEVQQALLAQPLLRFASLVVRRIDNGVCLQGVLEAEDGSPDVCSIAQRVAGVQQVLNRLVIAPPRPLPPKG